MFHLVQHIAHHHTRDLTQHAHSAATTSGLASWPGATELLHFLSAHSTAALLILAGTGILVALAQAPVWHSRVQTTYGGGLNADRSLASGQALLAVGAIIFLLMASGTIVPSFSGIGGSLFGGLSPQISVPSATAVSGHAAVAQGGGF